MLLALKNYFAKSKRLVKIKDIISFKIPTNYGSVFDDIMEGSSVEESTEVDEKFV